MLVDATATRLFAQELLVRYGADADESEVVTDTLIWSESRGLGSQGLIRLPVFIDRMRAGGIISPCHAVFRRLSPVAGALDGQGGFGQYLAVEAVRRAVELARGEGVSIVTVRNSNHFGAAGYYANQAAQAGMIALVTSNAFPVVAALGGRKPVLGTNPLAFAAPRSGGESLVIDMGTTFRSRTETVTQLREAGLVAEGVAVDEDGNDVTDICKLEGAALVPTGQQSFVLGLMVEVLSGILTGAGYSGQLHSFYRELGQPGNLGHLIICLHVDMFMRREMFLRRMENLAKLLMSSGDADPNQPVRLPGEKRWETHRKYRAAVVIPIKEETVAVLEELARPVDLSPSWRRSSAHPAPRVSRGSTL